MDKPRRIAPGIRAWILLLALVLPAACGPAGSASERRTVSVFAAASLTGAFTAMQPEFQRAHPDLRLQCSFGASSGLRAQIEQGAPADVFASADYAQMEPLARAGVVTGARTFARNRMVVVIPRSNPGKLRSLADLARPRVRVVAAEEAVPAGRYTRQVLEKLAHTRGFPPDFAARVSANMVSRETNVRGVLARVELAEADSGFVYETDARSSPRVKALPIPAAANVIAEYPIAIVKGARERRGAAAFVSFVLSEQGRAHLRHAGFK